MIYVLIGIVFLQLCSSESTEDIKTFRYKNNEYDAMTAYIIAGLCGIEHSFQRIPVYFNVEQKISFSYLSQIPQEVETHLLNKNYFIEYLLLQFQDRNISWPYIVVNIPKDDTASVKRIQSHIDILKQMAAAKRLEVNYHE